MVVIEKLFRFTHILSSRNDSQLIQTSNFIVQSHLCFALIISINAKNAVLYLGINRTCPSLDWPFITSQVWSVQGRAGGGYFRKGQGEG